MSKSSLYDYLLKTPLKDKWKRIGIEKRAGILIPLFSVYSRQSLGIGDLYDLRLLIDWAGQTGNSIIQLLPMNGIGSTFCPYDSLSSFALEPMYLSLQPFSQTKKNSFQARIREIKTMFPVGKQHLDYRLKEEKINLLRDIFLEEENLGSPDFKNFIQENNYWLDDFSLFKAIKDCQGARPWYEWEDRFRNRDKNCLKDFCREHKGEINFQLWMQWQLYRQFKALKKYAEQKKILIMGDLPLFVSRDSADVWSHQEFFKLDYVAGAPVDMYCAKGQRWGMPTYNWEKIACGEYKYLREKLKYAEHFYDLLRIDHVVGLFRIWSIPYNEPLENKGLNGFFDPPDKNEWGKHGSKILSIMLESTKMLFCAEDLGIIPEVCTQTLKQLGIPGNDVQRWVKDWKKKHDFLAPEDYRALSVTMLSTHDTTNWLAWWKYEAGTIDEELFQRRCAERGINYDFVKTKLFDLKLSSHGRLRWLGTVTSSDMLISILAKPRKEIEDFIEMYENSFQEKEKLWKRLGMRGGVKEKLEKELLKRAIKMTLDSRAIFSIHLIIDWLGLSDLLKEDPDQYRINTPGIISEKNWSLVLPICLEDLLRHKLNKEIRAMISAAGR